MFVRTLSPDRGVHCHESATMRLAMHVLGLLLVLPVASAWMVKAPSAAWSVRTMRGLSVSQCSAARLSTRAVRCCATEAGEEMPPDFETVCSEAAEAVRDGLLRGRRGLRVDVGVPSLDPGSRMYEPAHLARVCLEIAKVRARARARAGNPNPNPNPKAKPNPNPTEALDALGVRYRHPCSTPS